MTFESLKIENPTWGENKGKLVAEIKLTTKESTIQLILPNEVAARVLSLAKEALIDGVEKAANDCIFELTTAIPDSLLLTHEP